MKHLDRPVLNTTQTFCMITNVGTFMTHAAVRAYPFHLTLCEQILFNGDYATAMSQFADRHDTRLILDNGAHEGKLIDDNVYMNIIANLLPDVFVLPDLVGHSAYESRCRSLDFAVRFLRDERGHMAAEYDPQLIYTIQGNSPADVQTELDWINAGGLCDAIGNKWHGSRPVLGVGQVYLQYCFDEGEDDTDLGRKRFFDDVRTADTGELAQYAFHILGGRWTPLPVDVIAARRTIVGLDSVKPLTCTLDDTPFTPGIVPSTRKIDLTSMDSPPDIQKYYDNVGRFCHAYNLNACPIDLNLRP